jgi:hypothetical protein
VARLWPASLAGLENIIKLETNKKAGNTKVIRNSGDMGIEQGYK